MNEADTRARLIDPKLKQAGWGDSQITREHYYQRDHQYTQGRVILVGDRVRRGEVRKADYLLRYTDGFAVAVVEAKSDKEPAEAGLEQAKGYAKWPIWIRWQSRHAGLSRGTRKPTPNSGAWSNQF